MYVHQIFHQYKQRTERETDADVWKILLSNCDTCLFLTKRWEASMDVNPLKV